MLKFSKISHPLPYSELVTLLKDAYSERLEAGLNFACASFDSEDLKKHLSENAIVFGAFKDGKLVGMNVLNSIRKKCGFKFGTSEFGAIATSHKRQGIGYRLFLERIKEARKQKLDFILSDTAVPATSAILYHKKVGFIEYGHSHYPGRTYESINFILPLTFKGRLLSNWLGRKILGRFFTHK